MTRGDGRGGCEFVFAAVVVVFGVGCGGCSGADPFVRRGRLQAGEAERLRKAASEGRGEAAGLRKRASERLEAARVLDGLAAVGSTGDSTRVGSYIKRLGPRFKGVLGRGDVLGNNRSVMVKKRRWGPVRFVMEEADMLRARSAEVRGKAERTRAKARKLEGEAAESEKEAASKEGLAEKNREKACRIPLGGYWCLDFFANITALRIRPGSATKFQPFVGFGAGVKFAWRKGQPADRKGKTPRRNEMLWLGAMVLVDLNAPETDTGGQAGAGKTRTGYGGAVLLGFYHFFSVGAGYSYVAGDRNFNAGKDGWLLLVNVNIDTEPTK